MHFSILSFLILFFVFNPPLIYSSPILDTYFTKSTQRSPHHHHHHHHHRRRRRRRQNSSPQRYFEITHPIPTDNLIPSCSNLALGHCFGNTIGGPPFSVPYSPPPSNCTWSHAVLEFRVSCKGDQYDRIAAVWLAGAELLRTSTAEPTEDGVFWTVRKDVTRYSSLLAKPHLNLTVMLENVVNDEFTGVYHVNISFIYYNDNRVRVPLSAITNHQEKGNRKPGTLSKLGFEFESEKVVENADSAYEKPADLIIPISGALDEGFWFRIENESDVHSKGIQIPPNSYKAMLEVYISSHGDDEFWYSNPPDSYIKLNNLTTGRAHGAYRQVFVTIDGNVVASVIPFPVIFTGGINPLFWEPVVSIGAFEVPSYDFDLTPFLELLLDGKNHSFGFGVAAGIQFWLVDANLQLWLDHGSSKVQAKAVDYRPPTFSIERHSQFNKLDGSFKIKAGGKSHFIGWVNSTAGNFTTHVLQQYKLRNLIKFHQNGTQKLVKQRIRSKTEVRINSDTGQSISRAITKSRYPLTVTIATITGYENGTEMMLTNVSHGWREKATKGAYRRTVNNRQDSNGWMMVQDHSVLSGAAYTHQLYNFKDDVGCYSRAVRAANGMLLMDNSSFACTSSF